MATEDSKKKTRRSPGRKVKQAYHHDPANVIVQVTIRREVNRVLCARATDENMSKRTYLGNLVEKAINAVTVSDELHANLAALAAEQGRAWPEYAEEILARHVGNVRRQRGGYLVRQPAREHGGGQPA